ncbi:hypothetical protein [Cellulomonas sp.]|uniref:hypothetical protein n=1 Tax=Cellulomonas sp. TaxID=40001 RepID=UPI002589A608|nr:hypothetical protein [Cellulomonas sp.]MCR6688383.1 hypothetical protein [Cellulomonas sp.]
MTNVADGPLTVGELAEMPVVDDLPTVGEGDAEPAGGYPCGTSRLESLGRLRAIIGSTCSTTPAVTPRSIDSKGSDISFGMGLSFSGLGFDWSASDTGRLVARR